MQAQKISIAGHMAVIVRGSDLSSSKGPILILCLFVCLFVFVVLRPMSTAMVIAGRSVHLTTLFPGQA